MREKPILIVSIVWLLLFVIFLSSYATLKLVGVDQPLYFLLERTYESRSAEEGDISQGYSRLDEIRQIMKNEYYLEVSDGELIDGAIRGMLESVDDQYTFYYTPEEMSSMNEHSEGVYEGIGLILSNDKDDMLTVLRVFKGSPSQISGIVAGDRIVSINSIPVTAKTSKDINDAIDLVKSAEDPNIALTVLRDGATQIIYVTREVIEINRVDYTILGGNIGYVAIYEFMGNDVSGFEEAIRYFQSNDVSGVVLDIRSNPGGLLTHVVSIADVLLPEGLIVYIEDRNGKREEYFSDAKCYNPPMVVLVNSMSASASEILAGALKDYELATIVGETTYGKGIVQTVIPFRSDGAGMQLTTARYFTPKGESIHEKGIEPDVYVERDPDYDESIVSVDPENDAQLKKALEALRGKIAG